MKWSVSDNSFVKLLLLKTWSHVPVDPKLSIKGVAFLKISWQYHVDFLIMTSNFFLKKKFDIPIQVDII